MLFRRSSVGVAALAALLAGCSSAPLPQAVPARSGRSRDPDDHPALPTSDGGHSCPHAGRPQATLRELNDSVALGGSRSPASVTSKWPWRRPWGCWPQAAPSSPVTAAWVPSPMEFGKEIGKDVGQLTSAGRSSSSARAHPGPCWAEPLSEDACRADHLAEHRGLQSSPTTISASPKRSTCRPACRPILS